MAIAVLEPIIARIITFFGFAGAAVKVIEPYTNELEQAIWEANPTRALDAGTAAEMDAQGILPHHGWKGDANQSGVNDERYRALVEHATSPPPFAELLDLWRRGEIDTQDVLYGLRRQGVPERYIAPLMETRTTRLDPATVANAVQQGFLPNDNLLAVTPPATGGKVPTRPPLPIDPVREAQASGFDRERLEVMARLAGLPPGPETLIEMLRRELIDVTDVERGIAEGHTKTEWTQAYLGLRARLLTEHELANAVIRQWLTFEEAFAQAAKQGVTREHFQLLVDSTGRPPGPETMQRAYARGLVTRERFNKAIAESDVRPEWADVEFGLRFHYPSLFQLRGAVQSGAITPQRAVTILGYQQYEAQDAQAVVASWVHSTSSKERELTAAEIETLYGSRYITREQAVALLEKLGFKLPAVNLKLELADARRIKKYLDANLTRLHSLYVGHKMPQNQLHPAITSLGIPGTAADDIIDLWTHERAVNLPAITRGEVQTALRHKVISSQAAHDLLLQLGYHDTHARIVVSTIAGVGVPGGVAAELTSAPPVP